MCVKADNGSCTRIPAGVDVGAADPLPSGREINLAATMFPPVELLQETGRDPSAVDAE